MSTVISSEVHQNRRSSFTLGSMMLSHVSKLPRLLVILLFVCCGVILVSGAAHNDTFTDETQYVSDDECPSFESVPLSDAPCRSTRFPPKVAASAASNLTQLPHSELLYIVAAIFNPSGYDTRYKLYDAFAAHVSSHPYARLVTVECIFPKIRQRKFQVTKPDNPLHFQITSNSVLWSKEDMINYAIRRLPPTARYVAWIDADLNFHNPHWVSLTLDALQVYSAVQMFAFAYFLGPEGEARLTYRGIGYAHTKGIWNRAAMHPGYAWAMRRETFEAMGGLPDFHILGNADEELAFSFVNYSAVHERKWTPSYKHCTNLKDAQVYSALVACQKKYNLPGGTMGYVNMNISHNWHGRWEDRGYWTRGYVIESNHYNPNTDLTGYNSSYTCPGNPKMMGMQLQQLQLRLPKAKAPKAETTTVPSASGIGTAATPENANVTPERAAHMHSLRMLQMQQDIIKYFASRIEIEVDLNPAANNGVADTTTPVPNRKDEL